MLTLDGSRGEGGGQILRTALALSTLTGRAFRMQGIRAKRKKPGLLRQHLTCVQAAAAISGAVVHGAELGSAWIEFKPNALRHGKYSFAIGTAGSTTLVLQTILFGLLHASETSEITLEGGTHNPFAPPFDFLERAFLPLLARMNGHAHVRLERAGFAPAGGGRLHAQVIGGAALGELVLIEPQKVRAVRAVAMVSDLPFGIAERELAVLKKRLDLRGDMLKVSEVKGAGPGNIVTVFVEGEHVTEVFTCVGEKGLQAEVVASRVADEVAEYLAAEVPVGRHLADQLLLPMALGGGGVFRTLSLSEHARTQIETIKLFMEVGFKVEEQGATTTVTVDRM